MRSRHVALCLLKYNSSISAKMSLKCANLYLILNSFVAAYCLLVVVSAQRLDWRIVGPVRSRDFVRHIVFSSVCLFTSAKLLAV